MLFGEYEKYELEHFVTQVNRTGSAKVPEVQVETHAGGFVKESAKYILLQFLRHSLCLLSAKYPLGHFVTHF